MLENDSQEPSDDHLEASSGEDAAPIATQRLAATPLSDEFGDSIGSRSFTVIASSIDPSVLAALEALAMAPADEAPRSEAPRSEAPVSEVLTNEALTKEAPVSEPLLDEAIVTAPGAAVSSDALAARRQAVAEPVVEAVEAVEAVAEPSVEVREVAVEAIEAETVETVEVEAGAAVSSDALAACRQAVAEPVVEAVEAVEAVAEPSVEVREVVVEAIEAETVEVESVESVEAGAETVEVEAEPLAAAEGVVEVASAEAKAVEVKSVEAEAVEVAAESVEKAVEAEAVEVAAESVEKAVEVEAVDVESVEAAAVDVESVEAEAVEVAAEFVEKAAAVPAKKSRPTKAVGFDDLLLAEEVRQAVENAGYESPTSVQLEIIPHMLEGRDVLAQSQTGTGKTAAFALPILSRLGGAQRSPQVLVLTPTRELAIQVAKSFSTYGACLPRLTVAAIYGGQDYEIQFRQLRRGAQVVVGTPGRVIDHIKRGTLTLSGIECLVLDEADEMLNMGFQEDVQFVLEQTPATRQTALFSATLPAPIRSIAQQYLKDPVKITIQEKTVTAESIHQRALFVDPRDKVNVLTRILEIEETDGVIVFTKTKDATISVAEQLCREGLSAIALNGDMPQKVRERAIDQLKSGHLNILVATDVAARGLDVTRVSHVFNFDLPHDNDSYVHRVGRTGRAGRKGEAVIFLTHSQRHRLRLIEQATKQPIEVVQPPSVDEINAVRIKRFKQRISDTIAGQDLSLYQQLVSQHAEESGQPLEAIAAALAQIGQQGRPFLMQERPRRKKQDRDGRKGRDRFESGSQGGFAQRSGKAGGRRLGPPAPGMNRYRIEVGWQDGVKPGNIVGAVANEAGLEGDQIGPIKIHDAYSTIDLPAAMPSEAYQILRKLWVAGKQLRLSRAGEEGGAGAAYRSKPYSKANHSASGKVASGKVAGGKAAGKPAAGKRSSGKDKPGGKAVPAAKRKKWKAKA